MSLERWVRGAREQRASDLHLEPGIPPMLRVEGGLRPLGEPVPGALLEEQVRGMVGSDWSELVERRSWDGSRVVAGVQCRLHAFTTARGMALSVRLLRSTRPTLDELNLHPDLASLVHHPYGLVLVCGPTGSGKSSTLAALVDVLDQGAPRHVITLEQPLEYRLRGRRSLIRQREVGRDTPSFEAGLLDALREDPDVILVGEMRRVRTMQLTLDAAETGHLVLATVHASTPAEALQRLASAFAPEFQDSVRAQLAGCLVGVLAQRLVYRPAASQRVPECELLLSTAAVRHHIREGAWQKLAGAMELGAGDGMWTLARYGRWLDGRTRFTRPRRKPPTAVQEPEDKRVQARAPRPSARRAQDPGVEDLAEADDLEALVDLMKQMG